MQVETPKELVSAYANQVIWLEKRLQAVKDQGVAETDRVYTTVVNELDWAKTALIRIREVLDVPKGRLVQVLKSKVYNLRNKIGRVTYVNTERGYATVTFDGGTASHALSLKNLLVIDMPVPSVRIPAAGMVVRFKDDPEEYVAVKWNDDTVYVEPMTSVNGGNSTWDRECKRKSKMRVNIESINGVPPV